MFYMSQKEKLWLFVEFAGILPELLCKDPAIEELSFIFNLPKQSYP